MTIGIALITAIWALALGLAVFGTWLALRHFGSSPPHLDAPFALYPVSILKPLKGRDAGLLENLESFFLIDYPDFEILFSVSDARDPAAAVVRELMVRYPRVQARLITGSVDAGPNPKVNNLIKSYAQAAHDWLLISDSNVRVKRDYLKRLVAHVDNGTGVVTSVVAGQNPEQLGGHLESVYLNTFYARWMLLTASFGKPAVVGKSMLFRRSSAERFGGIKTLANYLAEDYMAGEAMRRLGLKVQMAHDPLPQHLGRYTTSDFWSRHVRWGRIRKAQAPVAFAIEPLLSPCLSGVLGAFALEKFLPGPGVAAYLALHLFIWSFCDLLLIRRLRTRLSWPTPVAWFVREALYLPLWLHIASGNTVNWRGNRLTLQQGGLIEAPRRAT
jgi:ceramide glucosyltransferase